MMFQIWEYIIFMGVLWPKIENVLSKVYVVVCILFFVQPLPTTQALAFDYVIYTKKESKNNNEFMPLLLSSRGTLRSEHTFYFVRHLDVS